LQQLLDSSVLNPIQKSEIAHLIEGIKKNDHQQNPLPADQLKLNQKLNNKLIFYLFAKKEKFQNELYESLEHLGYKLIFIANGTEFQNKLNKQLPSALV